MSRTGAGIYVILLDNEVVYVGRTMRSLARRLREFYRHQPGKRSPHRGGQAIISMPGDKQVYWSVAVNPKAAETTMLDAFEAEYGCLPIGNRRRGDR
jgi:hypothetical protein